MEAGGRSSERGQEYVKDRVSLRIRRYICPITPIFTQYPNGMYFDEFVKVCENITSEFAYGVLDTINQQVPCI